MAIDNVTDWWLFLQHGLTEENDKQSALLFHMYVKHVAQVTFGGCAIMWVYINLYKH